MRRIAAEIRQQVESQGQAIGMADYMIAAVCIATDGVLLTRNRKHFERIKGLRAEALDATTYALAAKHVLQLGPAQFDARQDQLALPTPTPKPAPAVIRSAWMDRLRP